MGKNKMTYENYIKGRIVEFVVAEEWCHSGFDGMCAVAQVLANRVNAGWGDWSAVLDNAIEYRGTVPNLPKLDHRDPMFRRMLLAVDDIYNGVAQSYVNIEDDRGEMLALYYADLNDLNRDWFRENVTDKITEHPRLATVGPLTFFA